MDFLLETHSGLRWLVLVALIFVVINMTVDLLYFVVDPRLSVSGERA